MVWLVEKKIFRYILDMGYERAEIPIRVKFEFEVVEGSFVPDTLTRETLYNQVSIEKRYPKINRTSLNRAIDEMVDGQIKEYMKQCGFLRDNSHDEN